MCTKKHADKEYDVPEERKKMDFDDRFACITPTRGDESFSSHYVLSRNTLATENIGHGTLLLAKRSNLQGGEGTHRPRHELIKTWLLHMHQRLKVSLQPHILRSTW